MALGQNQNVTTLRHKANKSCFQRILHAIGIRIMWNENRIIIKLAFEKRSYSHGPHGFRIFE